MKRYTFIRIASQAMCEGDIGIFVGDEISREAYAYDRPSNLYIKDESYYSISMALGIAIGTERRVFIFCEDSYLIRNLSEMAHLAVSAKKNIFIIVHQKGFYLSKKKLPTIFNSLSNPHGVLFNMGFKVHDYSKSFSTKRNPLNELKGNWKFAVGPLVVLMRLSNGTKSLVPVPLTTEQSIIRLKDFILSSTVEAYERKSIPEYASNLDISGE